MTGLLLLGSTLLYLVPRSAALGAVLLTGYLGGAVATHLRVGDPLWSHTVFPVYVGVLIWAGLVLRRPSLAPLLGLTRLWAAATSAGRPRSEQGLQMVAAWVNHCPGRQRWRTLMKKPPEGWPRISSAVFYDDAGKAIDWLCRAFGFEVQLKIEGEGGRIEHSELSSERGW